MKRLRLLLKPQKKLIIIFLLTIVLPSLVLSIFGILAIRNEKYSHEKQILDEQQNAILLLKKQFSTKLKSVENFLMNTAQLPAFGNQDYKAIRKQLNPLLSGNDPVEQIFILFKKGNIFFPLLEPIPNEPNKNELIFTSAQQTLFIKGLKAEFTLNNFETAISLFRELADEVTENNTRAQMLNNLARVQKKSGKISAAINTYNRITEQYPLSISSVRLPLALTAEMQIIDCERLSGNDERALNRALMLYDKLLDGEWKLSENQFFMYTEISKETIEKLLKKKSSVISNQEKYKYYTALQEKHQMRLVQWRERKHIESEIIPALKELTKQFNSEPLHLSRLIQGKDFLITAVPTSILLCIKWDCNRIIREWLAPIVDNLIQDARFRIVITDLSDKAILGEKYQVRDSVLITGEFDNYFPPWKIRIVQADLKKEFGIDLFKSYYFWSILTLLIILFFGTLLITRTIGHEQEIMRMKSDFIASVSHELKTPLTSIKALTERLLAGKVNNPSKMHQYFSVIDQDTNKLMHLIKNILDFSKIEAGKKEYTFEYTNLIEWLDETIDDFCKDHIHDRSEIKKQFESDIPLVSIDRDALAQCINNLLDNAVKFSTNSQSVVVRLKSKSDFVIISVEDHGIGIPRTDLPQIFDKFYQASPSSRHSVKGTGLGLALVKHAIEAHGGKIEVQSSLGEGSIFTLFIPIVNPNL